MGDNNCSVGWGIFVVYIPNVGRRGSSQLTGASFDAIGCPLMGYNKKFA